MAEQLAELLLVECDLVLFYEADKVRRPVAGKGRFTEMRILRNKIFGPAVNVGKIASPAARYDDLSAYLSIVLDNQYSLAAFSRGYRAKKPSCTAADDDGVVVHLGEVSFVQDVDVMNNVPGHYIGESPC